ncbi:hypothetical protein [Streptomyces marispadix]|uniref:Integral membrane protein n=1 Tax=Streptomyces marispadix TaxID=2922868 RepID=A0ABS9SSU6_9ACTN|nr:hypothetical protein [Streptomyces marispadix]MCH6159361.1 hypothetical protein [Streptomyces marispadix]
MNRPVEWRYVAVGLGFVGLAGTRAAQGEPVWAAVFAVAAAVDFWLAVHEGARRAEAGGRGGTAVPGTAVGAPAASGPAVGAAGAAGSAAYGPDPAVARRSLERYRTSARQWQVIGAVGVLLGGALLMIEPPLAVFAGAAALFALYRARRDGRAVATLRRAALAQR